MTRSNNEIRTRQGNCPTHGAVAAEKTVPAIKFPLVVTGIARAGSLLRPYRCPDCGAKVS